MIFFFFKEVFDISCEIVCQVDVSHKMLRLFFFEKKKKNIYIYICRMSSANVAYNKDTQAIVLLDAYSTA